MQSGERVLCFFVVQRQHRVQSWQDHDCGKYSWHNYLKVRIYMKYDCPFPGRDDRPQHTKPDIR